jgi:pyruvate, water dikinase
MISKLEPKGIRIPSGYATTAQAYWDYLEYNGLREKMVASLKKLDNKGF